ncbi:beta-xylosidase family glycoside hydrolase [Hungatella hathewayi]
MLCANLCQAVNTLTQRMTFPSCSAHVTVDGRLLKEGDFAGICALQGCYGMIALARTAKGYDLVMMGRPADNPSLSAMEADTLPGVEYARIPWNRPVVSLRVTADFQDMKDEAIFFYLDGGKWNRFGIPQKLFFKMDHFCGCRVGLFCYSTAAVGGTAGFSDFIFH